MVRHLLAVALAGALLFDGAYVDSATNAAGESAAGDQGDIVSPAVSAGHFLLWFGEINDDSPTPSLTFGNGDTTGTVENSGSLLATAFRMNGWPVQNTNGGTITGTYDGSENDGDRWNAMAVVDVSGISTTDAVEDSASGISLSTTVYTSPTVDCASSCFLVGIFGTNRDPSLTGTGTAHVEWTPTGADGFTYLIVSRRESGAGTYSFEATLDSSGAAWANLWALNESGGGAPASPLPALINPPRRGGGDRVVRILK